jgi:osmotically-inducible protein OsmY
MSTTDERIKKDIVDQLYWDVRVDASDVKVDVENKKAKLLGKVPSYTARSAAEYDARTVLGVKSVANLLTVNYPAEITLPTDTEIKTNIETLLAWDPDIDTSNIDISVKAGIVTLEGSVDAYWKTIRAEQLASRPTGVLSVNNKLAVVPTKDFIDQAIADDIVSAIDRSFNVDVESVTVKVVNGRAILSGTVPNWAAYEAVMDAARYTAGVTSIDDNLIIEWA